MATNALLKKVEFDTRELNRAVRKLDSVTKKDLQKTIRKQMGLLVQRCMDLTPPFTGRGKFGTARKQGEAAVKTDIEKIFHGTRKGSFNKYSLIMEHVTALDGRSPLFADQVDRELHESMRDKRGRVNRREGIITIGGLVFPDKVHVPRAALRTYIKERQKKVGSLKSGWNAAATFFRSPRGPAWVRRHGSTHGGARDRLGPVSGFLEATNRHKAIAQKNSVLQIVDNAIRTRTRDIIDKTQRVIAAQTRKFSR